MKRAYHAEVIITRKLFIYIDGEDMTLEAATALIEEDPEQYENGTVHRAEILEWEEELEERKPFNPRN